MNNVPLASLWRDQHMPSVCLTYKPYAGIRTKFFVHAQKLISASAYASVCCRSRTFLGRIQPMSNVHLPFVSVYQRMTDFVHTLAYAGVIRNSVKWVLPQYKLSSAISQLWDKIGSCD